MNAVPIIEAITVLRRVLYQALSVPMGAATPPAGVSYRDSAGRIKCYWFQADQTDANDNVVALPFVIYQSQDGGGRNVKHLGDYAWEGLVTIKALANGSGGKQSGAETLLNVVLPGMNNLAVTGYSLSVEHERPLIIPPSADGVWQAAQLYRVAIYK